MIDFDYHYDYGFHDNYTKKNIYVFNIFFIDYWKIIIILILNN